MSDPHVTITLTDQELKTLCGCLSRTKARFENQLEISDDPDWRANAEREIRTLETLKLRLASRL